MIGDQGLAPQPKFSEGSLTIAEWPLLRQLEDKTLPDIVRLDIVLALFKGRVVSPSPEALERLSFEWMLSHTKSFLDHVGEVATRDAARIRAAMETGEPEA